MLRNPKRLYPVMAALTACYVVATLLFVPSTSTLNALNISRDKAYAIIITFDLLMTILWSVAAYGLVQLVTYWRTIRHTKDGEGIKYLTLGLGLIAFRMPITSIIAAIFGNMFITHPSLTSTAVIFNNYLSVIVAVAGFSLIGFGSEKLVNLTSKRPHKFVTFGLPLLALALVTAYTFMAIGRGGYQVPPPKSRASFYLPGWLIVSTIIVPYAYAWYRALTATYNLRAYSLGVKCVVYRESLQWMSRGIGMVVVNSIILQLIGARGGQLNKLRLAPLLFMGVFLICSISAGYGMIAYGAKKLKRIEEV
ncbi:MAG: hypothetical protein QG553_189 [Patescibacteria group bacterium]|nr:hypothetical protein [Patescibacteria group bacterium]